MKRENSRFLIAFKRIYSQLVHGNKAVLDSKWSIKLNSQSNSVFCLRSVCVLEQV